MAKVQRNSEERKAMLSARAHHQRERGRPSRMIGVPASINRRTLRPHDDLRERRRRCAQVALIEQSNAAARRTVFTS